jgi:hypothetical protein
MNEKIIVSIFSIFALLGGIFAGTQIDTNKVFYCETSDHYRMCDKLSMIISPDK